MDDINTPLGTAPVIPVLVMSAGAYLCWFGIHYWRSDTAWPTDPIKAVLTGKAVPTPDKSWEQRAVDSLVAQAQARQAAAPPVAGGAGGAPQLGSTSGGSQIATTALQYVGAGYVFGGNASSVGNWDCSSFVSYVLGHDLGLPLPGGKWGDPGMPPHTHGPTTLTYMLYGTPVTTPAPGDLIISSEHMGIVIGNGEYVAARTPSLGVGIDKLSDPFPGGNPVFRRLTTGGTVIGKGLKG